ENDSERSEQEYCLHGFTPLLVTKGATTPARSCMASLPWLASAESTLRHVILHLHHRNGRRDAAERIDQATMLGVERSELIGDPGMHAVGEIDAILPLLRAQLRGLLRRDLRLARPHDVSQCAAGQPRHHSRAKRAEELIEHACLLRAVRLPEELRDHAADVWRLVGRECRRQAFRQRIRWRTLRNIAELWTALLVAQGLRKSIENSHDYLLSVPLLLLPGDQVIDHQ